MMTRILVIEDEKALREVISEVLRSQGFEVVAADDGLQGITEFKKGAFDLVLADVLLPKIDGFTVCEMIRQSSSVPIIILSALDSDSDQLQGFSLLVNDYITKPFSVHILIKRIEAVLRRTHKDVPENVLTHDSLRVDTRGRKVFVSGEEVQLTAKEYDILELLLKHRGKVFSRRELLSLVWDYDHFSDEKIVNIHIMNIRNKVGDCISTVRGIGYRIDA